MGGCNSIICSEEKRIVEFHKRQNKIRFKQAAGMEPKVSSSVEMIDIESHDESLSDESSSLCSSSSFSSESDSHVALQQEDLQALEIRGTPWPPCRVLGEVDVRRPKPPKKKISLRSKERKMEQVSKRDQSDSTKLPPKKQSSAPPAPVRHFSHTGPPPRPSPWKEVYLTMIKPNEQLVEENMKRRAGSRQKKKRFDREEKIHSLRKELAKKFDSVKRKTSYIRRRNTPEDQITEQDNEGVAHCSGDESDDGSSTSVSPVSTRSSSRVSRSSSLISEDSFEEAYEEYEKKSAGKSRRLFTRKQNKVCPV